MCVRMTPRWTMAALVIALLFIAAPSALAQDTAAGQGVIEGAVTGAAGPVADAMVTLGHFDGMTLKESQTAQTDAQGRFSFTGLSNGDQDIYLASVTYAGVEFSSGMLVFDEGEDRLDVTLTVTETTDDDSGIVIERTHLIVKVLAEGIQVTDMDQVSNLGETAYVGTAGPDGLKTTLRFFVPAGASQVAVDDGGDQSGRFVEIEGGLADTRPVPPGESVDQIIFSYVLPAQRQAWTLEHRFAYPVKALNVLVSAPGWKVASDQLTFAGTMGGDAAFENYATTNLPADGSVSLTFTPGGGAGMAAAAGGGVRSGQSAQGTLLLLTVGLSVVLLAGLLVYPVWRDRPAR